MKALGLAIALAACGGSPPPAAQSANGSGSSGGDMAAMAGTSPGDPTCPVIVPGTSVTVEDTPTGAAFVFVTTGDVAAVRKSAGALAAMHAHGGGPAGAMGMMIETPSTATESDIEGGARVAFDAKPADVGKLQTELRTHASHLVSGSCEMSM